MQVGKLRVQVPDRLPPLPQAGQWLAHLLSDALGERRCRVGKHHICCCAAMTTVYQIDSIYYKIIETVLS